MAFENYNIRQFKNAWFNNDFSEIPKEEFSVVYNEYVDAAGLFETEEFNKITYIHFLDNRINSVKMSLLLHKKFINEFDYPFVEGFDFLANKFGYYLKWKNDKDDFIKQLENIELKEKKYISELEGCLKELQDYRNNKNNGEEVSMKQIRSSFIRTVNSLGKIGYNIDNEKTTVEELSLMIKQQTEENDKYEFNTVRD